MNLEAPVLFFSQMLFCLKVCNYAKCNIKSYPHLIATILVTIYVVTFKVPKVIFLTSWLAS